MNNFIKEIFSKKDLKKVEKKIKEKIKRNEIIPESVYASYIYWKGYYNKDFFIDYFLSHYKKDKKTWKKIASKDFHKEILHYINKEDTCIIIARDHWKTTTEMLYLIWNICYRVDPSILLIMSPGLGLEVIWKIREEFENNKKLISIFWILVPQRTRTEQSKKWSQKWLQFLNWIEIETIEINWKIRGKRPTLVLVDDPQEHKDVKSVQKTDEFNYWFFSTVYNVLDNSWRCIIIGTIIDGKCFVNHIAENSNKNGFKIIKYDAIENLEVEKKEEKYIIKKGTPIWPEKWSIAALEKRLNKITYEIFMQEYMNVPYILNWNPVFNLSIIKKLPKTNIYKIDEVYNNLYLYRIPWISDKWGERLFYWVDTSSWTGSDFSTISIRDSENRLYAVYRDKIEPDLLCWVIDRLFNLGYKWILWIEKNNTWIATLSEAKNYDWYSYIYKEKKIDKVTQKKYNSIWWSTNGKTKPLIIENMKKKIREKKVTEFDEREKKEILYFYWNEKGGAEALNWHHDDLIMADAIALYLCEKYIPFW